MLVFFSDVEEMRGIVCVWWMDGLDLFLLKELIGGGVIRIFIDR